VREKKAQIFEPSIARKLLDRRVLKIAGDDRPQLV